MGIWFLLEITLVLRLLKLNESDERFLLDTHSDSAAISKSGNKTLETSQLNDIQNNGISFKKSADFDFTFLPWFFVLILGVVCAFVLQKKRFFKNYTLKNKESEFEIKFSKSISSKTQVHLIKIKNKEVLLVESTKNVQCISLDSFQLKKEIENLDNIEILKSNKDR